MKNVLIKSLVACAAATVMAGSALAADFYAVGSVGSTMASSSVKSDADNAAKQSGLTNFQSSLENGTGFKIGVGFDIAPEYAVEASYLNMGTIVYKLTANGQTATINIKPTGMNLSLIGKYPLNDAFSLMGKVGYTSATMKGSVSSGSQTIALGDSDKSSAGYGFGAIYKLTKSMSVRGEWEKLYEDINMVSASLQYKF